MSFSGWLLCRPWLIHSHMRPQVHFLLFIFLCCSIRRPKRREILPLIRSKPHTPPSQPWSYCCLQLSVDFLGILIDWRPPKAKAMPNVHRSIIWWGMHPSPQTKEPTAAPPNPLAQAFNELVGIRCTKSWRCGECCHGNRGQSRLLEGRAAMAHLVCCVRFLCCVLWLRSRAFFS